MLSGSSLPVPRCYPCSPSVLVLLLIAIGGFVLSHQLEPRASIMVPAVLLPPRTFTARAQVTPTGVRTYPATPAQGTLTITNGSVIAQTLPAGLIFITNSGISVVTDTAVFVPAGSANGYGYATVVAHALMDGRQGNIPALAINTVEGSSVYIRNLTAFRGGRDAYSVKFVTAQDRQAAIEIARQYLAVISTGLHYPCNETVSGAVTVTWRCQFVTYKVPAYTRVTGVRLQGKNLIVDVIFVAHPIRIWAR
jgi:baseplate J-like protein